MVKWSWEAGGGVESANRNQLSLQLLWMKIKRHRWADPQRSRKQPACPDSRQRDKFPSPPSALQSAATSRAWQGPSRQSRNVCFRTAHCSSLMTPTSALLVHELGGRAPCMRGSVSFIPLVPFGAAPPMILAQFTLVD